MAHKQFKQGHLKDLFLFFYTTLVLSLVF